MKNANKVYDRGSHLIRSLVLMVTEDCNLRCEYCYVRKRPNKMDIETAEQAVDLLFSVNRVCPDRLEVGFFGGEPMMEVGLIDHVCRYARDKAGQIGSRIGFAMTTNATMFSDYGKRVIREHNIGITCSLDGVAEIHDRFRKTRSGQGSFHLIEKAIPFLVGLTSVNVRMTVMPETTSAVVSSLRCLINKGLKRFSLSPVIEARWDGKGLGHLVDAWEGLYSLQEEFKDSGVVINNIGKVESLLCSPDPRGYGCGAARSMAAVDSGGRLYPCHRFVGYFRNSPKQSIGDVFKGFDDQKRKNYITSNLVANQSGCGAGLFDDSAMPPDKKCNTCLLQRVCGNSCIALNEYLTGQPQRPAQINRVLSQIVMSTHIRMKSGLELPNQLCK
jgi:uncharacterized protein